LYGQCKTISHRSMMGYVGFLCVWIVAFTIDPEIRSFIKDVHTTFYDQLFSLFHWYGKANLSIALILILYVGGLFLGKSRMRATGRMLFESFAFSGIVVTILKSIFGRWRPFAEYGSYSFRFFTFGPNEHLSLPSGDVAIAFAFSTIIAGAIDNKLWKWMWYLFAVITSIGRIYHDQHWLSDVLLASVIALWIGNCINTTLQRANQK